MEITTEIFRRELNSGKTVVCGSEVHQYMHRLSQEALRITAELNGSYHEPEEVRSLFSQLIGQPVDDSFTLFPLAKSSLLVSPGIGSAARMSTPEPCPFCPVTTLQQ
jgi:hypothetical protein